MNKKQLTAQVPEDLYQALQRLAKARYRTLSQEVRLALMKHLSDAQAGKEKQ